jgi:hypothetical protein
MRGRVPVSDAVLERIALVLAGMAAGLLLAVIVWVLP